MRGAPRRSQGEPRVAGYCDQCTEGDLRGGGGRWVTASASQVIRGIVCQNIAGLPFKAMMDGTTFHLGLDAKWNGKRHFLFVFAEKYKCIKCLLHTN